MVRQLQGKEISNAETMNEQYKKGHLRDGNRTEQIKTSTEDKNKRRERAEQARMRGTENKVHDTLPLGQ